MNKKPTNKNQPNNINPQNQLNIQNNIFTEHEFNAIAKLSDTAPSLAQRAMNLLEKTAEHTMQVDKEIIELERQEQKHRASGMHWYYGSQILGVITALIFVAGIVAIFAYLAINDKPNAWLSLILVIPFVIKVLKLGIIKKH